MKKSKSIIILTAFAAIIFSSCEKGCYECHYDGINDEEVELGEKCDEELENLEKDGILVNGTVYEVHCNEH
jgi:hypothetical protein